MTEDNSVIAVGGRSRWAIGVHLLAIAIAMMMFLYLIHSLEPLYWQLIEQGRWSAVLYLASACMIIPAYWPGAVYRMLLFLLLPFSRMIKDRTFRVLDTHNLVPVSIVIATRNEPASIVIPLLESLLKLDYPDFEIVIADNSDILDTKDAINEDLLEIVNFAETHFIRFIRRDQDSSAAGLSAVRHATLNKSGVKGNVQGGKAGNLNAALQSTDKRYKWFFILDSDSLLPDRTLRQMMSIGLQGGTFHRPVGFVQSVLSSANPDESSLSRALSVIDGIYYDNYFRIKATVGVVSNWGHGILVSRKAWEDTGGFPLEISEDLAWANQLLLQGNFDNYYALCNTFERKPTTWEALKIQRDRWAKGTTIQVRKQLVPLWRSRRLLLNEKLDLTYDMTSYIFSAIGCVIPIIFLFSSILGTANKAFFQTLVPVFYFAMAIDNLLVPLESIRKGLKGNIGAAWSAIKAIPFISIYIGAIASQTLIGVTSAFLFDTSTFSVTPKIPQAENEVALRVFQDNKICYVLFLINGWVTINAWSISPAIVPLLAISPIAYLLAPLIRTGKI